MANELEPRPNEATTSVKDLIPVSERGLVLRSLDDMFRFAQYLAQTKLTPKGLDTPSQILLAIQMGSELGLPPMASIQNIAVINGRPSIWGDAALAVCQEHPNYLDHDEDFDDATMTATCKIYTRRRGMERPITRTFSMSDAKTAQLQGKSGPWSQYPKRMLQLRARGFALRDAFPGALRGLLTTEEVRDLPPREVQNEADDAPTTGKMEKLVQKQGVPVVEVETEKPAPVKAVNKPKAAPEPPEADREQEPPYQDSPPVQEDAAQGSTGGREPGMDDDDEEEPPFDTDEDRSDGPMTDEQNEKISQLRTFHKVGPKDFARILFEVGNESAKLLQCTSAQAEAVIQKLQAK